MPHDYIPAPDPAFNDMFTQYHTYANANSPPLLTVGEIAALNTAHGNWTTDYPAHQTAAAAATSARTTKDASRAAGEAVLRTQNRALNGRGVSDVDRAGLGLTIPDTIPTPVGPPTTAPEGTVDTSQRLQHTVGFRDPTSAAPRAKPAGVQGCEIRVKIGGAPPIDASETEFVIVDPKTPHTVTYDGTDANKTAHYMLRWISTRGEPGPWSETVSASITA